MNLKEMVKSIIQNLSRQLMRQWFSEERGMGAIFSKPRFYIKLPVINLLRRDSPLFRSKIILFTFQNS